MNFRTIFEHYISILETHRKELNEKTNLDLNQIKGIRTTIKEDRNARKVEYTPNQIRISIPKKLIPNHCIPRSLSGDISITLTLKNKIIFRTNNEIVDDPFIELNSLDLTLNSGYYTSSWHLDRHIEIGLPNHFHPFYHLTFGGQYMEDIEEEGEDVFGKSLIIRAPRISHPPMDLFLGFDFVLTHFFSRRDLSILKDPAYIDIMNKLKEIFWKPYALCLAKHYYNSLVVDGKELQFNNTFVENVNGIYR